MFPPGTIAPPQRVNVLGVGVSAITMAQGVALIDSWVAADERRYVCVTGVHGVMESQSDPSLRAIHNSAGLVTPDGMPLVWLSRVWSDHPVERVYGPDLLLACCNTFAAKGYRHYFYGGAPGIPERLADRLRQRFPEMCVAGTWSPPFGELPSLPDPATVDRINAARPDIVWVGLSTPKQERWMALYTGHLTAAVLVGVGAAFDFHAGEKRQAPLWMQRSGLEWLFRLATEPRRLWRRYLSNNPRFVYRVLLQWAGLVRYDLSTQSRRAVP